MTGEEIRSWLPRLRALVGDRDNCHEPMTLGELALLAGVHRNSMGKAESKTGDDLKDIETLRSAFRVFGLDVMKMPARFPEGADAVRVKALVRAKRLARQKGAA